MAPVYITSTLYIIGLVIAIFLLVLIAFRKESPGRVFYIHGSFVLISLAGLVVYACFGIASQMQALLLFTISALGGMVVVHHDLTGKKCPLWLHLLHCLCSIAGFAALLLYPQMNP